MNPEGRHRTASVVRAIILPAVAAVGWLVFGAATAQADAGINLTPSPASSPVVATVQPAALSGVTGVPPVDKLPPAGLAVTTPALPVPDVPAAVALAFRQATPVVAAQVPQQANSVVAELAPSVVAAVGDTAAAVLPQLAEVPPQLPGIPTLPTPSAVLPDAGAIVVLPAPITVTVTAEPFAAMGGSPSAAEPASGSKAASIPAPSAGTPRPSAVAQTFRADIGSSTPLAVTGWTAGSALPTPNGSGQPEHQPLDPIVLSGLSTAPATSNNGAPQPAAEPAYAGSTRAPWVPGSIPGDDWGLPDNPALAPGSSPD